MPHEFPIISRIWFSPWYSFPLLHTRIFSSIVPPGSRKSGAMSYDTYSWQNPFTVMRPLCRFLSCFADFLWLENLHSFGQVGRNRKCLEMVRNITRKNFVNNLFPFGVGGQVRVPTPSPFLGLLRVPIQRWSK